VVGVSGSRLPGDSDENDRHKEDERAAARISAGLAERLDAYCANNGETQSDVVREALDEFLPKQELPDFVVPKDPELADAYKQLARHGQKRVCTVQKAVDILAKTTHTNTPKALIRDDILVPLEDGGLIGVKNGKIAVHPLTPIDEVHTKPGDEEIETDADYDDRLDDIADATAVRADGGSQE
jgi:predicted DNA-binding protein